MCKYMLTCVCIYIHTHTYCIQYQRFSVRIIGCVPKRPKNLRGKAKKQIPYDAAPSLLISIDIWYIPYKHVILIINQLGCFETTGSKQANFNVGWWRLLYYSKILPTIVQFLQLKPSSNFSRANMLWTVSKWQTWLQYWSTLIMSDHVS